MTKKGSRKFVFTEKFISYADVEIYAESEENARLQFQNGNYQYYDVSTSQMDTNLSKSRRERLMVSSLNSKDYVTFARRFVKETVEAMDIEELRSLVTNQIHEEIQEGENEYGQSGAFDEMIAWNEDVFLSVAEDFELEFEGV